MSTIKALGIPKIKALGINDSLNNDPYLDIQVLHYPKNFNDYIQVEISTNYNPKLQDSIRIIIFEKNENGNSVAIIDKYYDIKANKFIVNIPFNQIAQNKSRGNNNSIQCYLGVSGPNRGAKYSNIFNVDVSDNPQVGNQSIINVVRKPFNNLSNEDQANFIATVLVESGNGRKALWDIAWIYLNLIQNLKGVDKGLSRSSAYKERATNYMFKCHYYYLTKGKSINKYGNDVGTRVWNKNKKVKEFVEIGEYLSRYNNPDGGCDLDGCINFIIKNIFVAKPATKYNDWEGQGNTDDMNINTGQYERVWDKARQYYWLQKMKKTKDIFVKRLYDGENTSYLYDNKNIDKYFKSNPAKLPKTNEIPEIPHFTKDGVPCKRIYKLEPTPEDPKNKNKLNYEVELNEYGGIKKVFQTTIN